MRRQLESEVQSLRFKVLMEKLLNITIRTQAVVVNVDHADVWSSALETFQRPNFSTYDRIRAKFTNYLGQSVDKIDMGGPRREFLRLLMSKLQSSKIFTGPMMSRQLTMDEEGLKTYALPMFYIDFT